MDGKKEKSTGDHAKDRESGGIHGWREEKGCWKKTERMDRCSESVRIDRKKA